MPRQTADQTRGPTGKMKNCNEWALYESPGASLEANLCHGGWVEGDYYEECPARYDCKRATQKKQAEAESRSRSLPVLNPAKPFGQRTSTRILGGTKPFEPYEPTKWSSYATTATSRPTKKASSSEPQGHQEMPPVHPMFPAPVIPPESYPKAMQSPFAAPAPFHAGGITPTFLPNEKHGVFSRLAMNIAQGWVGSTGWHVFDFARSVDMFGQR